MAGLRSPDQPPADKVLPVQAGRVSQTAPGPASKAVRKYDVPGSRYRHDSSAVQADDVKGSRVRQPPQFELLLRVLDTASRNV